MQIDVIDRLEDFAELKDNWDSVYAADPEAKFFLSWTWLSRWLETERIDWFILAAKPDAEASSYVAFFPLKLRTRMTEGGGFYNRISMAGGRLADYTGFICADEFQDRAIPAFADHMTRMHWAKLEMRDFCVSDERLQLFLQYFEEPEFKTRVKESDVQFNIEACKCPSVSLPADWDSYLNDRLGSNTRQKIRRFLRKVENSTDFRITYAEDGTVGRDLDILLRFWKAKWGRGFAEAALEGVLNTFRTMLLHCFESGVLFLPILWKGEVPLAALACLTDAGKGSLLFFIGGRDETFRSPPPGFVLHAHSIRYAIGKGLTTYDFLRGDEAYKYAFGAEDRRNKYVVVTTANGRNLGDRLDPRSVSTVLRHSGRLRRKGRLSEAETGYRQILDVEPRSVEALFGLGRLLAAKGDHRAAAKSFRSCVALDPKAYQSWFRLGQSLAARREFSDAADAYREVLKLRPESYSAHRKLSEVLSRIGKVEGAWRYQFPEAYDRGNIPWIGEVRRKAFDYLFNTGIVDFKTPAMCLDLACGTGITTLSLAEYRRELLVIGIDTSRQMLAEARRKAEQEGLTGRCSFREADVLNITLSALPELEKHGRIDVDMITCALGFSVFPRWEEAFHRTNQLLHDDGVYVIFDQYLSGDTGLAHPGMGANQSRESWKLLEKNFINVDIKWFDNTFIAIGHKKKARSVPSVPIEVEHHG